MLKILVTGSRDWTNVSIIEKALLDAWASLGNEADTLLVQGECHLGGADLIAKNIWESWGMPVKGFPAEFDSNGRVLGPKRNAEMVAFGADICLAFPLKTSRGTWNCIRLAKEAGIPVLIFKDE